jgi:serine/threonine protein kinase
MPPPSRLGSLAKLRPGQTLDGRFQLLEEIARGGMSIVYKATDLEAPDKPVAVKVPLPEFSSGLGNWSMFQREAEIGARLDHPAIVRFLGPPVRHRSYVVTELLDGMPLSSRTGKGRRVPEAEALRTLSQVCEPIAYMHDAGFVHYDLKPANVMVLPDGSMRVLDLGMAHEVIEGRFALSAAAPPFATSSYVAPEQVARRRGQRSVDIYALGAMLYEMLTGHPPFEGDDPFVVASARQIGDPKGPRELCPDLSEQAEEIVLRALRRSPSERYPSVAALKADLDDPARVRVSGLARRLVAVTRARKGLRWLRVIALVGVAPLAFLVVLFRLLWWFLERKPH